MKKIVLPFFTICILFLVSSCANGFQICKMTAVGNKSADVNSIVFEDDYCKVSYNLWGNGGDAGFMVENKSQQYIYINLSETFFVKNGKVYDYYLGRTYTNVQSQNSETTLSKSLFSSSSSTPEQMVVCIPPHTYRTFSGYKISSEIYRDCTLLRSLTSKKDERTVNFSYEESPVKIKNIIGYCVEKNGELHRIETDFYLSQVSNLTKETVIGYDYDEFCGEKSSSKNKKYFKVYDAGSFYLDDLPSVTTYRKH